jgi:spore maturation protein CgeB/2-polyprenyl-3-methyl-5-hydroxy-6-metoxy-1,4-benzoquinol methylase
MSFRILTFNWHESYIHLLAKTGYEFAVVEREKAGIQGWIHAIRPVPANCRLVSEREARAGLQAGTYDRIIAHNLEDLLFVREVETPKVLLFHNKLSTEIALGNSKVDRAVYLDQVGRLIAETKNLRLVFISEAKKHDWGLDGEIILPGVDAEDYGGYRGEEAKVLRIGNGLKERDLMLGYSVQERVVAGLPSTILGLNAQIPQARVPKNWDEYRDSLRRHRVYLNTTVEPYEDGYNLAMLEAMATGIPVVSTHNRSSPIEDGVNGYVSEDECELRTRLKTLMKDRSLAASLGRGARRTVLERFPLHSFLGRWAHVLEDKPVWGPSGLRRNKKERRRILMRYTSNPQTTGAYLEKALRMHHDVITYGPSIQEDVLTLWDMAEMKGRVREHDIPYYTKDMTEVFHNLPKGWDPDLFLWVESGIYYPMEGVESLPCPTACYLVDTHLNLEKHLDIARAFDCVFVAQKEFISTFEQAGIQHVTWLPLACDPEVHRKYEEDKRFEVAFVGSITPLNRERNALLMRLAEKFPLHVDRCFLEEMALTYSRAKIVFNRSIKNDLNMRVFEAMATGSLLVTDEAQGSGLTDFFQDQRHLVIYRSEAELFERVDYYLENHEERERIAAEGRREVLRRHSYEVRAAQMMDVLGRLNCRDRKRVRTSQGVTGRDSMQVNTTKSKNGDSRRGIPGVFRKDEESEALPLQDYYKQERKELVAFIPEEAEKILDVGCGGGHLGKLLKKENPEREIWGVDVHGDACEEARRWLDHVSLADARQWNPPVEKEAFDVLVFADVLEHLPDPKAVLDRLLAWLKPTGSVVMSIPNVRFWAVVKQLVDGYWTYQDEGLLDRDHLRFFTWTEVERLLESCGLECVEVRWKVDPRCPHVADGKKIDLQLGRLTIHDLGPEELREFFVFQYFLRAARTKENLLEEAQRLEASGMGAEAFAVYAALAERDGGNEKLVKELARVGKTPEERKRASALLDECLRVHPANIELLIESAELLAEEQRVEEAKERLERVLLFVPNHVEAKARLDRLPCP